MTIIEYKGYTIEEDANNPYHTEYLFYPTDDGLFHDYDLQGEDWIYCGNANWADSIEDAKLMIDEL